MNRHDRRNQRGQSLALVAVMLVALLASAAIAVDAGFAFTARSESQRITDASSLAGASIFLEEDGIGAVPEAKRRAKEYAARNAVRGESVDTTLVATSSFFNDDGFEVFQDVTEGMTVQVIPGEYKVRVWVGRDGLPSWFARILGWDGLAVSTVSAAVATEAGSTDQCVLPFAMPDLWDDADDDTNENNVPDDGEDWEYEEGVDEYRPWDGSQDEGVDNGTGYGSNHRDTPGGLDDDQGLRIWIKAGPRGRGGRGSGGDAGGTDDMVDPGNFLLWRMPDPDNDCQPRAGANWVRENIQTCNACPIGVGEPQETQTGNIASIKDEIQELIDADPGAYWDPSTNSIVGSSSADPLQSPRVRIVPIWAPNQDLQGQSTFTFNNFARVFLEGGSQPPDFAIYARFLEGVSGGPGGPTTGPLVRYLRLVE